MTILLDLLKSEVELLEKSGEESLHDLIEGTESYLQELKLLENDLDLLSEDLIPVAERLDNSTQKWYKSLISQLKSYNGQINKFSKNVASSSKFEVALDDAYTFPLAIDSRPSRDGIPELAGKGGAEEKQLQVQRHENTRNLMKSIAIHLLKSGNGDAVAPLVNELGDVSGIDAQSVAQFKQLNQMLDKLKNLHDLTEVLHWLTLRPGIDERPLLNQLIFKCHILQFALHLAGPKDSGLLTTTDSAAAAYTYARANFPSFSSEYMSEILPVITLLLFKPTDDVDFHQNQERFKHKIVEAFTHSTSTKNRRERLFIAEVLGCFDVVHSNQAIFDGLAQEFVAEYCAFMNLSRESPLFQSLLAGFVNLPNFYKYTKLQQKLGRKEDGLRQDLPFQLPDKNQFLFEHHPIFICPVLKEQLMPLTTKAKLTEDDFNDHRRKPVIVLATEKLVPMSNPVVVFDHCRHLALKDSVRQLTKGGSDIFKCHYCYKKHRFLEVSDAYFIDL